MKPWSVHQILPDGHRVAAARQPQLDDFAVRLAGAGRRTAARLRSAWAQVDRWTFRAKVGGHLYGRFCRRPPSPTSRRPHRDPAAFRYRAGSFPPNAGGLLNTPQRPSQPPQRNDLLFLFFAQDIHLTEGKPPVIVQCPGSASVGRFSGDHHWPVLGDHRGHTFSFLVENQAE